MMAKTLYNVSVELVVMVLAESEKEAKKIAMKDAMRDDFDMLSDFDLDAAEASYLPGAYSLSEFVYHDGREDITVQQAIEMTGNKMLTE
jgi:hypothetical protein